MTADNEHMASWASALMDGEALLIEREKAEEASTSNQLFYYSVTRQVIREECCYEAQNADERWSRVHWSRFWAEVEKRQKNII